MTLQPPTLQDVHAAAEALRPHIHHTPVMHSRTVNHLAGRSVFFKCENLQRVGAFKTRGAFYALLKLSAAERERGVATHSSGNHGQAVALAGATLGVRVTVVVPHDAPAVKVAAIEGYGAKLVRCEPTPKARNEAVQHLTDTTGAIAIPPFEHPDVIAGQGTAVIELLEAQPDLTAVVVPVGGGGLLAGAGLVGAHAGVKIFGAEPSGADDAKRSFDSGKLHPLDGPARTLADGVRTPLGALNFELIRQHITDIAVVDDDAIIAAMRLLWERMKLVVEPSGALPLAAMLALPVELTGPRVGIVLSGGNVDTEQFFSSLSAS